ncbi:thioredoxin family protein [Mucilaginibacter sp. BJC16-A38]|uniref:thioredoxin family protein n=1 Tax=Mucilaginibacter phenanthrenivorans TaxID=1234842 RepID=UPI0021578E1E|nr:thioredoxin family protein [Mucilaginibacter phenanthrenivorans]MCR8557937.1 thioredoxin family protein [Mucilaginibacter phenanthrenivorans]
MKTRQLLIALFMLMGSAAVAQTALPASETVLNNAYAQAAKENKKVILIFHASWCGWCKKMDASLNDPICKKMFDDNYVIAHLDVMEQPAKANLENPGGMEVMKKFGGEKSGLPYWLVLDTKGNVLANSLMPKDGATTATAEDNVGCPASDKEVAFFDTILKKTSALSSEDIAVIHKRFLLNQPPPQPAKGTN